MNGRGAARNLHGYGRKGRRSRWASKLGAILLAALCLSLAIASISSSASKKRFANCTHAVAVLAPSKARVNFRVDCWAPRRGGELGFAVTRLNSDGEARHPGIRGFDRHPTISGPGALSSYGHCSRGEEAIGCELRGSDGNVTLRGSIRVGPETRCAKSIYISTGVTTCEPTVNQPCPASLQIAVLFRSLPRGC
jgi:hypothetical protein